MRAIAFVLFVTLCGGAFSASAATLVGDEVTSSFIGIQRTGIVGDGYDTQYGTALGLDFNAGADGLEFRFDALFSGSFSSIAGAGTRTFILSDLNFSDGAALIGFELISSLFADITVTTTADSVTLVFTDQAEINAPTTLISGRFLTDAAPVPIPAGGGLMAIGLLAGGFAMRRRAS